MGNAFQWFAIASGGTALRVGPLGLVVGRHPSCDLVVDDPRVSRRHLLLQPDGARLRAVALAEGGTILNGRVLDAPIEIGAGDVLTLPDGTALHVRPVEPDSEPSDAQYAIELAPGLAATLRTDEATIGGGWQDDIVIDGWPSGIVRMIMKDGPSLVAVEAGVLVTGRGVAKGEVARLVVGDTITVRDRTIRVVRAVPPDETTIAREVVAPRRIELELLPTGGRITVHVGLAPRAVMLSERRFALAVALLAPTPPDQPGQFIADEELLARVWPRRDGVDRGDLNQLVHRLRGDLAAAGLDGTRLIERLPKGGATRFVIDRDTTIERAG